MKLIIMRGLPGSGKSTWIKNNNLEDYVISPDKLRLMFSAPVIGSDGFPVISQQDNKLVWKTAYEILENRFIRNSELTVFDATFLTKWSFNDVFNICKKYNVDIEVVDFTKVLSINEVKARNNKRFKTISYVPEEVIDRMYNGIQEIPSYTGNIKVITPE